MGDTNTDMDLPDYCHCGHPGYEHNQNPAYPSCLACPCMKYNPTTPPEAAGGDGLERIIDELVKHGVCTRVKRQTCEDCQRRIATAKAAIRQEVAAAIEQLKDNLGLDWPTQYANGYFKAIDDIRTRLGLDGSEGEG